MSAMPRSDTLSSSNLLEALKKLHRDVARAFEQEPDAPRTPENERERYAAALNVIAQYFSSIVGRTFGDRFFELASAIADLNSGRVRSLLRPVRLDHRPDDRSDLWRARARVALGLEALVRSGLKRDEVFTKIRVHHASIANLAGLKAKQSKLQITIFGWRNEFKAKRVKNFEASELFAEGLTRIDRLGSPERCRKFAMRQFADAEKFSSVLSPSS